MSEEEKEAIKTTKAILKEWQKIVDIEDPTEREIEMSCYIEEMPFFEMKTLLKIIKKQQNEMASMQMNYEAKIDKMEYEMGYDYISKDKMRDILLKFQNKYSPYLETTDRLFIGKEVLQYGEDILDEIAAELDIKLLEEE